MKEGTNVTNTLVTNKGKIFIKKTLQRAHMMNRDNCYAYGYTNLNVREMNVYILQAIKGCTTELYTNSEFSDQNNNISLNMIFGKTKTGKVVRSEKHLCHPNYTF